MRFSYCSVCFILCVVLLMYQDQSLGSVKSIGKCVDNCCLLFLLMQIWCTQYLCLVQLITTSWIICQAEMTLRICSDLQQIDIWTSIRSCEYLIHSLCKDKISKFYLVVFSHHCYTVHYSEQIARSWNSLCRTFNILLIAIFLKYSQRNTSWRYIKSY